MSGHEITPGAAAETAASRVPPNPGTGLSPDNPGKPVKAGKTATPAQTVKPGKAGKTAKSSGSAKTSRTAKTAKRATAPKANTTHPASPDALNAFLTRLAESGSVSLAASEAGLNRVKLFTLREQDADFAARWDKAREIGLEALEDEARSRALLGWEEEVWYKGEQCGVSRKYSPTLLGLLLKKDKTGDPAAPDRQPTAPMNPAAVMEELLRLHEEGG